MNRPTLVLAAAAFSMTVLVGCGVEPSPPAGVANTTAPAASSGSGSGQTLTVFAAASLKGTFTALGQQFETAHPGTKVSFSFAGSSDLVTQLQGGAPADVFASADTANMTKATDDDLVAGSPVNFATNTLEIAVPPDNPAKITSFADLTKPGVKIVVCAAQVPCGAAAQKIEKATNTVIKPVSEENAVTDVLGKVESGEADAGLVYVTDVQGAADQVKGIPFEESKQAVNTYPVAALAGSKNADLAGQFLQLVTGSEGQQVLHAAGFGTP